MKIGIIRETKTPPDSRVPFTPKQCKHILSKYPEVKILVQPSPSRSYKDEEYLAEGIPMKEDISDCDVLLGVKEVKMEALIPNKQYFFFSHTIKEQAYNKELLQTILKKKIQICDYETITNDDGNRVIAFGRWAGIVGAHNGIKVWGSRKGLFNLPAMHSCKDFEEAQKSYKDLNLGPLKIILTGNGRVSNGSAEVLKLMKIRKVLAKDFLSEDFDEPVYCQLNTGKLFAREDGRFTTKFYRDPSGYHSVVAPYLTKANMLINGIYWDNRAPAFFSKEDMKKDDFRLEVIADITCDIAPDASIPSTLEAATIEHPAFGYDVMKEEKCALHGKGVVDMMTVDNLPNELPRDASEDFGKQFLEFVLPELLKESSEMIYRASITTKSGELNKPYLYLTDYISD